MPPHGSRDFIKIKGQMYVENYLGDFVEQKTLYACPVCGTVKIVLWPYLNRSLKSKGQSLAAKQVQDKLRKVRVMYLKATKRINRVVVRLPGGILSDRNRDKILTAADREALYKEITGWDDDGRKAVIKSAFDVDREYVEDAFKDASKTAGDRSW